jgi:hypothetical protein
VKLKPLCSFVLLITTLLVFSNNTWAGSPGYSSLSAGLGELRAEGLGSQRINLNGNLVLNDALSLRGNFSIGEFATKSFDNGPDDWTFCQIETWFAPGENLFFHAGFTDSTAKLLEGTYSTSKKFASVGWQRQQGKAHYEVYIGLIDNEYSNIDSKPIP